MIALWAWAYYLPGLPKYLRIISPQGIRTPEGYKGTFIDHFHDDHDGYSELDLKEEKPGWKKAEPFERVYVKYYLKNNLPTHKATLTNQRENEVKSLKSAVCVINEDSQNFTPSQKELLRCHFRLGYIGFQHAQWLIRTGNQKVQENSKAVVNCENPKFAACEFGKGHCRPNKKENPMKEKELKKDHLLPRQMVPADHYILQSTGRLYHTKWKSYQSDILSGGCVFIDHAIGYVIIKHQVAINATENVKAKLTSERVAQSQGVLIKVYDTNNGISNASEFMEKLFYKQQKIRSSGASASHQNGAAERVIKTVVTMERTKLMHAAFRCPEGKLSTYIWPMAMDYAVWIYKRIPDMQSGLSAIEIWSRSRFEPVS